ncbi:inositol monophosphatase family protein [Nocardia sp. NPDC004068]|uniref:inositol monophosphatase family protein n=1 Tax=Nocardia sp. NPDC004068 TaxID=3364303 RepID=UPI0036CE14FF
MTSNREHLLGIARHAAARGGALLRETAPGRIEQKGDRDFVTDLDRRIEQEIRDCLREMVPGIDFLGEEIETPAHPETLEAVWVLDPIDGTSNFIHGLPFSAVSLALAQKGTATIGVVVAPFLGLEYYAASGTGAFCNGQPISTSRPSSLAAAIISLGDYAVGTDAAEKNQRRFALTHTLAHSVERIRMFGSAALDLTWVASGKTDACVMMSNKPWDTSAGVVIAREAGAVVTDLAGTPHTLSSAETVAVSPSIANELLELLDRMG